MPLYEYQCEACNEVFEALQKFSDEPLRVHATCGGNLRRLLSPPALQFKGSGWYVTDYARNGSAGKAAKSEPASGGDSKPPADTASKAAPAADKK